MLQEIQKKFKQMQKYNNNPLTFPSLDKAIATNNFEAMLDELSAFDDVYRAEDYIFNCLEKICCAEIVNVVDYDKIVLFLIGLLHARDDRRLKSLFMSSVVENKITIFKALLNLRCFYWHDCVASMNKEMFRIVSKNFTSRIEDFQITKDFPFEKVLKWYVEETGLNVLRVSEKTALGWLGVLNRNNINIDFKYLYDKEDATCRWFAYHIDTTYYNLSHMKNDFLNKTNLDEIVKCVLDMPYKNELIARYKKTTYELDGEISDFSRQCLLNNNIIIKKPPIKACSICTDEAETIVQFGCHKDHFLCESCYNSTYADRSKNCLFCTQALTKTRKIKQK